VGCVDSPIRCYLIENISIMLTSMNFDCKTKLTTKHYDIMIEIMLRGTVQKLYSWNLSVQISLPRRNLAR
jgi:hypothetical protein